MPEVTLFIDYEHVAYGALNSGLAFPAPATLMEKAEKRGRVLIARAFADFNEPRLAATADNLVTASIEKVHCPTETRSDGTTKHYTDFQILDNIYQTTHANPDVPVYVLMTGDGHFSPVAAFLKHRLQKTVVVAGLRGNTHKKLQDSGSVVDLLELSPARDMTPEEEDRLISFVAEGEKRGSIITVTSVARYFHLADVDENARRRAVVRLLEEGLFVQREEAVGERTIRRLRLNGEHPRIKRVLAQP